MALNTKNSGGLTGKAQDSSDKFQNIKMLKSVYVETVERNGEIGETIKCAAKEAKFLVAREYAKYTKADAKDDK